MIKLGVIMDPIETLHFSKDSTLAILFEAARRGWWLYDIQQQDLFLRNGQVFAKMRRLNLSTDPNQEKKMLQIKSYSGKERSWYQWEELETLALNTLDITLVRKDPPVDMHYIYATQLLEIAERQGALVFNRPAALRDANEKIFANWFPNCCPPTLISSDIGDIKAFLKEEGELVVKPLHGMGGEGIFRLTPQELNLNVILETLTNKGRRMVIAQRYLPQIQAGDKRVLMINGYPLDYVLARIPAPGETRANLAAGGKGVPMPLGKKERQLCEQIGPTLREKGLIFVGIDIIGDYVTEINVTSPTCIRELEKETTLKISQSFLDVLENSIDAASCKRA